MARHVHKYVRLILKNGAKKARCAIPGCAHYINYELAIGRTSICNVCNEEYILERRHFKNSKLHCDNCFKVKEKSEIRSAIVDLLGDL
jgi:hypothetical protein